MFVTIVIFMTIIPTLLFGSPAGSSEGKSAWHIPESVDAGSVDESVDPGIEEAQLIQEVVRPEEKLRRRNQALIKMRDAQEKLTTEAFKLVDLEHPAALRRSFWMSL